MSYFWNNSKRPSRVLQRGFLRRVGSYVRSPLLSFPMQRADDFIIWNNLELLLSCLVLMAHNPSQLLSFSKKQISEIRVGSILRNSIFSFYSGKLICPRSMTETELETALLGFLAAWLSGPVSTMLPHLQTILVIRNLAGFIIFWGVWEKMGSATTPRSFSCLSYCLDP